MRWTKMKQLIEDRMAPSLAGRVQLHVTTYGIPDWTRDTIRGRLWVTIDGQEAANFSNDQYLVEHWRLQQATGISYSPYDIPEPLRKRGIFPRWWMEDALWGYLSLPIEDAIRSDNPLIRALTMTDRRVGKRRLRRFQIGADEHPLIQTLYALRCQVEGIQQPVLLGCE